MLQQIRTTLLKISIKDRHLLFYIRKDYNLMWSVVTDIGEKRKQAARAGGGSKASFFLQEQ
jgi:hypothetical protein